MNIDGKGNLVAGLASKWSGTTTKATYTLRRGVTCSDGSALTASQVAANINFVGDPKNASTRMGVFVPPGATATADDATGTVSATSATPDAFLARNVGGPQIVCAKGMADRTPLKHGADGTGEFTMTEAVSGDHYTMTRRRDYAWGRGTGGATSRAARPGGDLGPDKQRLAAQGLFERDVVAPLGELWFNHKAGSPGATEVVRRALTQALDLGQLAQVLTSGAGKPVTGLVMPGGPCTQNTVSSNLPAHDVAAARAALSSAGWTAGPGGVRVRAGRQLTVAFYYLTSLGPTMQAGAELVQKMWGAVGVDVTLRGVTDAEVGQLVVGGQGAWDAALVPLTVTVPVTVPSELVPFLSGPSAPGGSNFSGIDNAGYVADVRAAASTAGAAGCPKWSAAESSLFRHADMVPFVDSTAPTFGKGATFDVSQGALLPGSIRMLG